MDYKFMWLLEDRVILVQLMGDYADDVLHQTAQTLNAYIEQGTAPIYVVVDTTGLTTLPANFREPLSVAIENRRDDKVAWAIFVTSNVFFRFFGAIAGKFIGFHFRPAASLEEAIEVLLRINPELEALGTVDLTLYALSIPS